MNDAILKMYDKLKKDLEKEIKSKEGTLQYYRDIVKQKTKELRDAKATVADTEHKLGLMIEQLGHVTQQIMEGKGDPTITETSEELIKRLKTRMELLMED